MSRCNANGVVIAGLLILSSTVTPLRAELSAAELGIELRAALGFGSQSLSALAVTGETYSQIVADAESYCDQNRQTVEPLLTAVTNAKLSRVSAYESGGNVEAQDSAYTLAAEALSAACTSVIQTMSARLSGPQQTKQARFSANILLDPTLALLDLSSEQRQTLLTAQRLRDQVLKHGKNRKDLEAAAQAMTTFRTTLLEVLTQGQEEEFATIESNLHANVSTAQGHDESSVSP